MRAIVDVVKKDGKAFKGSDGEWYSTRDTSCASLVRGQEVEFENKKNGRWNNIVDNRVTVVGGGDDRPAPAGKAGDSTPPPALPWSMYADKEWQKAVQQRIGRQNALTAAVNAIGPVLEGNSVDRYVGVVLETAASFAQWTAGRDVNAVLEAREVQNPAPTPPAKAAKPEPTEAPAADFDDDITF